MTGLPGHGEPNQIMIIGNNLIKPVNKDICKALTILLSRNRLTFHKSYIVSTGATLIFLLNCTQICSAAFSDKQLYAIGT